MPRSFQLDRRETSLSDRCEILREYGAGGVATVYLALHHSGETDGLLSLCLSTSEAP
jgi:hypothetical protein